MGNTDLKAVIAGLETDNADVAARLRRSRRIAYVALTLLTLLLVWHVRSIIVQSSPFFVGVSVVMTAVVITGFVFVFLTLKNVRRGLKASADGNRELERLRRLDREINPNPNTIL